MRALLSHAITRPGASSTISSGRFSPIGGAAFRRPRMCGGLSADAQGDRCQQGAAVERVHWTTSVGCKRPPRSGALAALDIEAIAARPPQAKGRVERLWGTLQHRLVSELRMAQRADPDAGQRGAGVIHCRLQPPLCAPRGPARTGLGRWGARGHRPGAGVQLRLPCHGAKRQYRAAERHCDQY
jgi:hypothetical protein